MVSRMSERECCHTCRDRNNYICSSMKCYVLEDTCNALREERDELLAEVHDLEVINATLFMVLKWMCKE